MWIIVKQPNQLIHRIYSGIPREFLTNTSHERVGAMSISVDLCQHQPVRH